MNFAGFPFAVWLVFLYPVLLCPSGTSGSITLGLRDLVLCSLRTLPFLVSPPSVHDFVVLVVASSHRHFYRMQRAHCCPFPRSSFPLVMAQVSGLSSASGVRWGGGVGTAGKGWGPCAGRDLWGRHWAIHPALSPLLAGQAQAQLFEMTAWCLKPGSLRAMHSFAMILQCGSHCSRCWLGAQRWARQAWPLLPWSFHSGGREKQSTEK